MKATFEGEEISKETKDWVEKDKKVRFYKALKQGITLTNLTKGTKEKVVLWSCKSHF